VCGGYDGDIPRRDDDPPRRVGNYVASLFVYDEEDDPRKPTVTIGFNTEDDVAKSTDSAAAWATDEHGARWNYASWHPNELAMVCDSDADPVGRRLREE
jgi:hypothetical protein